MERRSTSASKENILQLLEELNGLGLDPVQRQILEQEIDDELCNLHDSKCEGVDRTFCLQLLEVDGAWLRHLPFKDDREVVLKAVQNHWTALQDASVELRSDRDIVLEATKQEVGALKYAGRDLLADKDFILLVARCAPCDGREREVSDCYKHFTEDTPTLEDFGRAARSSIASAGEVAPVLTISLSHKNAEGGGDSDTLCCEFTSLSGATLAYPVDMSWSANDLANRWLEECKSHPREGAAGRLFLVRASPFYQVTPWDWERPLSYIFSPTMEDGCPETSRSGT